MASDSQHKDRIIFIFNKLFKDTYRTVLMDGPAEPLYVPAPSPEEYHLIYFAHGFWNSALHEIAHWCIAGRSRRCLEDYGYWYKPDGRNLSEQVLFEKVERKPQALEWMFTVCMQQPFFLSVDNLSGGIAAPSKNFREAVRDAVLDYLQGGLPERAQQFLWALQSEFKSELFYKEFCRQVRSKKLLPS